MSANQQSSQPNNYLTPNYAQQSQDGAYAQSISNQQNQARLTPVMQPTAPPTPPNLQQQPQYAMQMVPQFCFLQWHNGATYAVPFVFPPGVFLIQTHNYYTLQPAFNNFTHAPQGYQQMQPSPNGQQRQNTLQAVQTMPQSQTNDFTRYIGMEVNQPGASGASIVNSKAEDETKAEETKIPNEEQNKKILKLSELTNIDPLEYFSRFLDIPEMILQHLGGKGLITASEVSPSYYNFIASSRVLMQKIKIVFNRDFEFNSEDLVKILDHRTNWRKCYRFIASSTDFMKTKIVFKDKSATQSEDFNLLKNSSRLYQNIQIQRSEVFIHVEDELENYRRYGDYVTNSELDFFYSKAHEWKNVTLRNVYFRKKHDLWSFLSSVESSVESISVHDYGVLSFEDPSSEIESLEALKFPKLKKLLVCLLYDDSIFDTLGRLFLNSVAIEQFDLLDYTGEVIFKDMFQKMLTNFDKLRTLRIASKNINQLFEDVPWENSHLKLKVLSICCFSDVVIGINVLNFLKSQSDHLEKLGIGKNEDDKKTFDVIMKMPMLKCLNLLAFSENEFPTKISTSITELTLHLCASPRSLNLLDSMPKVRNLSITSIDEEDFKILKSKKRKFDILRVCELKGVNRKDIEEIMTENYTSIEIVKPNQLRLFYSTR